MIDQHKSKCYIQRERRTRHRSILFPSSSFDSIQFRYQVKPQHRNGSTLIYFVQLFLSSLPHVFLNPHDDVCCHYNAKACVCLSVRLSLCLLVCLSVRLCARPFKEGVNPSFGPHRQANRPTKNVNKCDA
jgi:hypothetical protein